MNALDMGTLLKQIIHFIILGQSWAIYSQKLYLRIAVEVGNDLILVDIFLND